MLSNNTFEFTEEVEIEDGNETQKIEYKFVVSLARLQTENALVFQKYIKEADQGATADDGDDERDSVHYHCQILL